MGPAGERMDEIADAADAGMRQLRDPIAIDPRRLDRPRAAADGAAKGGFDIIDLEGEVADARPVDPQVLGNGIAGSARRRQNEAHAALLDDDGWGAVPGCARDDAEAEFLRIVARRAF